MQFEVHFQAAELHLVSSALLQPDHFHRAADLVLTIMGSVTEAAATISMSHCV